ncbi:MAG: hypothetical protein QM532_01530 [Cyanobium sp. MAG06]|nr:hypothetical protein [Cyanobium sp. MAG06]
MLSDDFVDDKINKTKASLNKDESERLAIYLSEQNYLPYINLLLTVPDNDALEMFDVNYCQKYNIAPFRYIGDVLHLGITDPKNQSTMSEISKIKESHKTIVYVVSQRSVNHILKRYEDIKLKTYSDLGNININPDHINSFINEKDIENIKAFQEALLVLLKTVKEEKVSRLIELLIYGAIYFKVSDIHIEPQEENVRYRYRIDGNLQDIF